MKRYSVFVSVVLVALSVCGMGSGSLADENFVPSGHSYGPGNDVLPPLNSEQDRINAMADIREAELQREMREQRAFQEHFRMIIDRNLYRPGGQLYLPY